jgi:uncharacterized protein
MNREEVISYLRSKKLEFKTKFHVTEIALFGSLARNQNHDESDIDLLIEFEPGTEDLYGMKEEIRKIVGDHFHTRVDIGRPNSLKAYYKKQIMSDAIFI